MSAKKTEVNGHTVRVPLVTDTKSEDVQELGNGLKVVKGYVNGREVVVFMTQVVQQYAYPKD